MEDPQRPVVDDETSPPCRVLLVDDSPEKVMSIDAMLSGMDLHLVVATSGDSALRQLLHDEFAVILLDVRMPGLDGFETAELIRQRRRTQHVPIIFMTAYAEGEADMSRAYSLGAVDFIFSPIIPDILRAKISVFIELHRKTQQVREQADLLRRRAERRADQLAIRLGSLLNRLEVGVFRCTHEGVIVEANPAFWRLVGRDDGAPGLSMREIFADPDDEARLSERLFTVGHVHGEHVRWRRGDDSVWVSLTGSLATGSSGERYADGLVEDISRQKEAEEVLVRKSEELVRTNAQLEQFAFAASHDLQEPLRLIATYANLLAKQHGERLDERGQRYLDRIDGSAQRMRSMINDLLAFCRTGSEKVGDGRVDCGEALDRAIANLEEAIRASQASITRAALPETCGESGLLIQLFQNLIGNAIKFRRQDVAPAIEISCEHRPDEVVITIADNGIGIPPEHRERVFDVFHRLHSRSEIPGTGIGLALCRKIVERHGGRIWAEPASDHGTRFRFTLPRSAPLRDAEAQEPIEAVEPDDATAARAE